MIVSFDQELEGGNNSLSIELEYAATMNKILHSLIEDWPALGLPLGWESHRGLSLQADSESTC